MAEPVTQLHSVPPAGHCEAAGTGPAWRAGALVRRGASNGDFSRRPAFRVAAIGVNFRIPPALAGGARIPRSPPSCPGPPSPGLPLARVRVPCSPAGPPPGRVDALR